MRYEDLKVGDVFSYNSKQQWFLRVQDGIVGLKYGSHASDEACKVAGIDNFLTVAGNIRDVLYNLNEELANDT